MGMDPATIGLIASVAGSVGGRIFAPEGQEISSFENAGHLINPHDSLQNASNELERVFALMMKQAATPPNLSHAYVQQPPDFSGGGLPMPIGVTGSWEGGGGYKAGASIYDDADFNNLLTTTSKTIDRPGDVVVINDDGTKTTPPPNRPRPYEGDEPPPIGMDNLGTGKSLLDMAGTPETGPRRLGYTPPGLSASNPKPKTNDQSQRAVGATSLLLHLAGAA